MKNSLKDSIVICGIVYKIVYLYEEKSKRYLQLYYTTFLFLFYFNLLIFLIGGKSYAGYCVGPSDLECCVKGSIPTSSAYGVDISSQLSSSTASCLASAGN